MVQQHSSISVDIIKVKLFLQNQDFSIVHNWYLHILHYLLVIEPVFGEAEFIHYIVPLDA